MSYDRNPPAPHPPRFIEGEPVRPPEKLKLDWTTIADALQSERAGYVLLRKPAQ